MRKFLTTSEYQKDLKDRRKKSGLCIICGNPTDDSFMTCSVCRLKKRSQDKDRKERSCFESKISKKKIGKLTIDEVNAMAKEKGLSYGIYVGLSGDL